jgi:ribosome-associated heat shock protein Hsp15
MMAEIDSQRLDKWLWAARFYKTRKQATDAITGGKVHLNGQRSKPGKDIKPGSQLKINKEPYSWEIEVIALNAQRRPASEAVLLYAETEASMQKRQIEMQRRKDQRELMEARDERPNKKQRRQINRFKGND